MDFLSKKKVLISGSAGFIGSNLVRHIIYSKYPCELYSLDKLAINTYSFNMYNNKLHEFFIADICDKHILEKIFEYVKPDTIVHLAASANVDLSNNDISPFIQNNIIGTQNLIDLSIKYGIEKFLYFGTDEALGALGPNDKSWNEDAPVNPKNPYSSTKAAAEFLVKAAGNVHKLPWIISRCSNNMGPRQICDRLVPKTIKSIYLKKPITIYGKGDQIREYIHVADTCSATLSILDKGRIGEIYNISTGDEMKNLDVVHMICDIMGSGHDLIQHVEDRKGHDFRYSLSSEKLRKETGWAPIYKFKDGLKQTIDWYLSNKFFLEA